MKTKESESGNLPQVDLLSKPNCSLLMSCILTKLDSGEIPRVKKSAFVETKTLID